MQGGELSVHHGIPEESFELECPDADFKAAVLQEFILLDGKYVERLDKLEDEHRAALRYYFSQILLLMPPFTLSICVCICDCDCICTIHIQQWQT